MYIMNYIPMMSTTFVALCLCYCCRYMYRQAHYFPVTIYLVEKFLYLQFSTLKTGQNDKKQFKKKKFPSNELK